MEIKNISRFIKFDDLDANIFEDTRNFCATSYDGKWCCVGIIVDWRNNIENGNPMLQINDKYKVVK